MILNRGDFEAQQRNKQGTIWDVWFLISERGLNGVAACFDKVKANSRDKAIDKVMKLLKNLEVEK